MAARLATPVFIIEKTIPITELKEWAIFFEVEEKNHTKTDYYMAQIAMMIVSPWTKNKLKIQDFLIKFTKTDRSPEGIAKKLCRFFGLEHKKKDK